MKHVTIFRDEQFYSSHASACQAKNGDLLVAFRQAPFQHVFAHVHPQARIDMVRSTDLGETWDPASRTTVYAPGDGINLNDPSLTTLKDGTIIVTAFCGYSPWTKEEKWGDNIMTVRGNDYFFVKHLRWTVVLRSTDNGHTWDGPYTVEFPEISKNSIGVFAPIVELSDGRLLLPVSASSKETGEYIAAVLSSTDKGETWGLHSKITSSKDEWMGEDGKMLGFGLPTMTAFDDNHLLAAGWSNPEIGTLVVSSDDGGKTWGAPQPVISKGECSHITLAKDGTAILSYGYRKPPYGVRVWPSYDGGKTWNPGDAAALRSDGAMRDLGYPRTIQLPDGRFFCVYYFNVKDEDKSYYDEEASMALCKKWNLTPPLFTYQEAGLRFIGGTFFTEEDMRELAGTAEIRSETSEEPTLL